MEKLPELRVGSRPEKKAVLHLDVDGVLIMFSETRTIDFYKCHPRGFPARRVEDFLVWADANFEVRWLTCWAMRGRMDEELRVELSNILGADIPTHWDNPMDWAYTYTNVPKGTVVDGHTCNTNKVNGLDFTEKRPWFWMDDEQFERRFMPVEFQDRLIQTNSSADKNALMISAKKIYAQCMRMGAIIDYPSFAAYVPGVSKYPKK